MSQSVGGDRNLVMDLEEINQLGVTDWVPSIESGTDQFQHPFSDGV
jgi:hypothetical protein